MNAQTFPIRAWDPALQDGVGVPVYTLHQGERIIAAQSFFHVADDFDGTTPHAEVYAQLPGHEGDDAYLWGMSVDLTAQAGTPAAGAIDNTTHHQTDDAIRRVEPSDPNFDYVFRDGFTQLYLRLTDGGYYGNSRATAPGSTTGIAWLYLTTWTPPGLT